MNERAQATWVGRAPASDGMTGYRKAWPPRFTKVWCLGGSASAYSAELLVGSEREPVRILTVDDSRFASIYATLHTLRSHASFLPVWEVVDLGTQTLLVFPAATADHGAFDSAKRVPKASGRFIQSPPQEPRADIEHRLAEGISHLCGTRLSALCALLFQHDTLITYRGNELIDSFKLLELSLDPGGLASHPWNEPHLQGLLRFAKDPNAHADELATLVARVLDTASPEAGSVRASPYPLVAGAPLPHRDNPSPKEPPSEAAAADSELVPLDITIAANASTDETSSQQAPPRLAAPAPEPTNDAASLEAALPAAVALPGRLPHPSELPPKHGGYYRPYNTALSDDITRTQTRSELSISPEYTPSPTPPVLSRHFGPAHVPEELELNIELSNASANSALANASGPRVSSDPGQISVAGETAPRPIYSHRLFGLKPKVTVLVIFVACVLLTSTALLFAMLATPSLARRSLHSAADAPTLPDLAGRSDTAYVRHHLCGTLRQGCALLLNANLNAEIAGNQASLANNLSPKPARITATATKPVAERSAKTNRMEPEDITPRADAAERSANAVTPKPNKSAKRSASGQEANDVRVRIDCDPEASVWINGNASGKCPLAQRLPPGWHSVAVGFDGPTERTLVELKASNRIKRIRVTLPPK